MPKFLVLIYGDDAIWSAATPEWEQANAEGHARFHEIAGDAVLFAAELAPVAGSRSVRAGSDGGEQVITDGPFLDTKEVIGGYYYLDAPDLDAATKLAALLPEASASHGGVEVRPILGSE